MKYFIQFLSFNLIIFYVAVCDIIDDLYNSSVMPTWAKWCYKLGLFKTLNEAEIFFNRDGDSWRNKYVGRVKANGRKKWWLFNKPDAISDAWHISKLLWLGCMCVAIVTYKPLLGYYDIGIYSVNWWFGFWLWYNVILRKK